MRHLTALLCFSILICWTAKSQFSIITQNIDNTFEFAKINESAGVAIVGGFRVTKSVDNGFTWTEMSLGNFGIPTTVYSYTSALIIDNSTYILLGKDAVNNKSIAIRTTDGGQNWSNVLESNNNSSRYFNEIDRNGNTIIIAAQGGIYTSTDLGLNWTYSTVPGVSSASQITFIEYNQTIDRWYLRKTFGEIRYSDNNGATWIYGSSPSGGFLSLKNNDKYKIEGNYLATLNNFGEDQETQNIPNPVSTSYIWQHGYPVSPDKFILNTIHQFFVFDTLTDEFFFVDHSITAPNGVMGDINDFTMGQTYGLAVGESGAISRFDLSAPLSDLYLPASFNTNFPNCPGDTLTGSVEYNYSDSVQWFYDGTLVSTDTNLIFETPYSFGAHNLVLVNWYTGNSRADSTTINFTPLQNADSYSTSAFQTPCFEENGSVNGSFAGSFTSSNKFLEIWFGDSLLQTYNPAPSGNFGNIIPVTYTQDTVWVISRYEQLCGVSIDTVATYAIFPGDNILNDFSYIEQPDSICHGTIPSFQFSNMTANHEISVYKSNDATIGYPNGYLSQSSDTITLTYNPNLYNSLSIMHFTVEVENNAGCIQTMPIDTIRSIIPNSDFNLFETSYLLNDTVTIEGTSTPANNWSWSSIPSMNIEEDLIGSSPIFSSNESGAYQITALDSPLVNCYETNSNYVYFGDNLVNYDIDYVNHNAQEELRTFQLKMDPFGNTYEIAATVTDFSSFIANPALQYAITKRDSDGNVLWIKKLEYDSSSSFHWIDIFVCLDVEFDDSGDPYFFFQLLTDGGGFNHYQFEFDGGDSHLDRSRCFISKFDAETGEVIWAKSVTADMRAPWLNNSNNHRYTANDLLISGDKIYCLVVENKSYIRIGEYSLNGNFIGTHSMHAYSQGLEYTDLIPVVLSSGYGDLRMNRCAKLLETSNGQIVVIGLASDDLSTYEGNNIVESISYDNIENSTLPGQFLFAADYSNSEFSNLRKLANLKSSLTVNSLRGFNDIARIDKNDDLVIVLESPHGANFVIGDSTILTGPKEYIAKMDLDGNLKNLIGVDKCDIMNIELDSANNVYFFGKSSSSLVFTQKPNYWIGGAQDSINELKRVFGQLNFEDSTLVAKLLSKSSNTYYSSDNLILAAMDPCGNRIHISTFFQENSPITDQNDSEFFSTGYGKKVYLIVEKSPENCSFVSFSQDFVNHCDNADSLQLPLDNYFSPEEIIYTTYNGTNSTEDTLDMSNGEFYITNITSATDSIVVNSPVSQSFTVNTVSAVEHWYNYSPSYCFGQNNNIQGLPTTSSYFWEGEGEIITPNIFSMSNTEEPGIIETYVTATDPNGCIQKDTISAILYPDMSLDLGPNNGDFSVFCGDTINLIEDESWYPTQSWTVNGESSGHIFSDHNLNYGYNNISAVVTDTNGCSYSYNFTIYSNCTAQISELETFKLSLKPNPASNEVTLSISQSISEGNITIIDQKGALVLTQEIVGATNQININTSALNNGIYFVSIEEKDGISRPAKLVIVK